MTRIPRVVLVDDRLEDRKAAVRVLDTIANVIVAVDSGDFEAAIAGGPVDVLITEQTTNWIDGFDAAARVRERWPHCACMMLTSTGSESIVIEAKQQRFTDYLLKTRRGYDALAAAVSVAAEDAARERPLSLVNGLNAGINGNGRRGHAGDGVPPDVEHRTFETADLMASGAVHEFNNLLTVILGSSSLLVEQLSEADPRRDEAVSIHSTAVRASVLAREWMAACQPPSDAAGPGGASGAPVVEPKATILLVDDEPAVRLFVQRTLEAAQYRVLIAETADRAIAAADDPEFRADVLLSDVVMPDTDGAALALALRAKRPGLRVLLMSGYSEASGKRIIARVDGAKFLSKPFIPATLVAAVEDVLR